VVAGVPDVDDLRGRASAMLGTPVRSVDRLPGGTSSLTYLARLDDGAAVLKVAPPGLAPVRNRDVLRQSRVLRALADVPGVAVPGVLAEDEGDPPDVPPMFAMQFVDGDSYEPLLDAEAPDVSREDVAARAEAAARMLAALHAADPAATGLDDPPIALEDEVRRWRDAFASVDGDLHPTAADTCGDTLAATIPAARSPAILHGDWRLGNMLAVGARIAAVIDWEIWSIGDPRLDLAWFLLMADSQHPRCVRSDSGMPHEDVLRRAYEETSGSQADDLAWFAALVRYKQAAASALIVKTARKRDPGAAPSTALPGLLRAALERLA